MQVTAGTPDVWRRGVRCHAVVGVGVRRGSFDGIRLVVLVGGGAVRVAGIALRVVGMEWRTTGDDIGWQIPFRTVVSVGGREVVGISRSMCVR